MKPATIQSKAHQETLVGGRTRAKQILSAGLLTLVALAVSGCGNDKKKIESSDNLKQLSLALIKFHEDNKAWPEKLDEVKPLIGKEGPMGVIGKGKDFAALMANPLTGDNPGYEYVKPKDGGTAPVVLYQLRGGKRDESLPVAFRDGSVRLANSPAP